MSLNIRIVVISILLVALQGAALFAFGQPAICTCGYLKFWEGIVRSSGNSQHLTDWYTFSHVIHGFLIYLLLWFLSPSMAVSKRFLYALGMEVCWEIVENTPWLIDHYRQQALSQGYVGDSIVNSLSDSIAMMIGFVLAWRLPLLATVTIGSGLELFVGYMIHDNLTLNFLNLIHSFPAVAQWQAQI